MNSLFSKIILLVATISLFASCDKDTNDLGSDIIGKDNFEFNLFDGSSVIAYNHKTGAVQTNNLNTIQFGVYEDPFFGTTTASFVTQILLGTVNPVTTGTVTDVTLEIPYFTEKREIETDQFVLDSIYGDKTNKINLSIYRSNVFLESYSSTGAANNPYFSNKDFDNFVIGNKLNDATSPSQNTEFFFDNSEKIFTPATSGVSEVKGTSMKLKLNNSFGTEILGTTVANLSSNGEFTQFYKGLYFKVEQSGTNKGCLSMLDISKGKITISYGETSKLVLNMAGGINVNLIKQINSPIYANAIATPNKIVGDDNLYLKGGDGSIAVIELFKEDKHGLYGLGGPNGIADIKDLKNSGWIINEANLVFNIDKNIVSQQPVANRILLYDMYNKREIIDYVYDNTTSTAPNQAKKVYGGLLSNNEKYKIRLTNHIRNLINKDSTNVKLGICVTQSINNTFYGKTGNNPFLKNDYTNDPINIPKEPLKYYNNSFYSPQGSIMNPLGVVLYGSKPNIDVSKRLKLEIYYTKPN